MTKLASLARHLLTQNPLYWSGESRLVGIILIVFGIFTVTFCTRLTHIYLQLNQAKATSQFLITQNEQAELQLKGLSTAVNSVNQKIANLDWLADAVHEKDEHNEQLYYRKLQNRLTSLKFDNGNISLSRNVQKESLNNVLLITFSGSYIELSELLKTILNESPFYNLVTLDVQRHTSHLVASITIEIFNVSHLTEAKQNA